MAELRTLSHTRGRTTSLANETIGLTIHGFRGKLQATRLRPCGRFTLTRLAVNTFSHL